MSTTTPETPPRKAGSREWLGSRYWPCPHC